MRPKKRSDEVDESENLPFKLGELVLCRYSSYPYWPATVDQTHQKVSKGKFVRWGNKSDGTRILTFWCTFSNEDTGGWVRADRMVQFHPKLVDKIKVDDDHDFYDDQVEALATAEADFKKLHKDGADAIPVPKPPKDFESGVDGDDDELESIGHDDTPDSEPETAKKRKSTASRRKSTGDSDAVAPPKASQPKAKELKSSKRKSAPAAQPSKPTKKAKVDSKKRKRDEDEVIDDVDEEPPVSRKRKTPRAPRRDDDLSDEVKDLKDKLEDANNSIANLKRRLRKRENQIANMTDVSKPVQVTTPNAPENLAVPARVTSKVRANTVSGDDFAKMFKSLQETFKDFKTLVFAADNSRSMLEREIVSAQEKFVALINDVKNCEEKAADKEKVICDQLKDVLEADVSIDALRTHKAGNFIKSMGKACKAMPLINHLCVEIRSTWVTQVTKFMQEKAADSKKASNAVQDTPKTEQAPQDIDMKSADTAAGTEGEKPGGAAEPASETDADEVKKENKVDDTQKTADKSAKEPKAESKESEDGNGASDSAPEEKKASVAENKNSATVSKKGDADVAMGGAGKGPDASTSCDVSAGAVVTKKELQGVGTKSAGERKDPAVVADALTSSGAAADAEGRASEEKSRKHHQATDSPDQQDMATSPIKDDSAKGKTASGASKNDSKAESAGDNTAEGKEVEGAADKEVAGAQGKADGKNGDGKGPHASPKRQQVSSDAAGKSEVTDTPRSVAVPSKVEQGQKGESDLPPASAVRAETKGGKSPAAKATRREGDRQKSEDKKSPKAAMGKETSAS